MASKKADNDNQCLHMQHNNFNGFYTISSYVYIDGAAITQGFPSLTQARYNFKYEKLLVCHSLRTSMF